MNDGLGLVFDDGWNKNYDPSSERSRRSYRSFAVLSVLPTADIGGLEFMALHCSGRMRKQDRGLIDLGCESETKLRRTHDKGKGARATPSNNLTAICSLTRLGWPRSIVGSDFHTDARSARLICLIAASSVFQFLARLVESRSRHQIVHHYRHSGSIGKPQFWRRRSVL